VKLGSSRNYVVSIHPDGWDDLRDHPESWLTDVVEVALQQVVHVVFVPDLRGLAPPWDTAALPPRDRLPGTPDEFLLDRAVHAPYVVTPNPALAGTAEPFAHPGARPGAAWYLTPADFRRRVDELLALAAEIGWYAHVDDLRAHEVIRFIDAEVVDSGLISASHAGILGR
jgi:hypothetical protein